MVGPVLLGILAWADFVLTILISFLGYDFQQWWRWAVRGLESMEHNWSNG